jgi:hypothetical protein
MYCLCILYLLLNQQATVVRHSNEKGAIIILAIFFSPYMVILIYIMTFLRKKLSLKAKCGRLAF